MKKYALYILLFLFLPTVVCAELLTTTNYDDLAVLSSFSVSVPEGVWRVGSDLPAGTYTIAASHNDLCYITYGSILKSGSISKDSPNYQTVKLTHPSYYAFDPDQSTQSSTFIAEDNSFFTVKQGVAEFTRVDTTRPSEKKDSIADVSATSAPQTSTVIYEAIPIAPGHKSYSLAPFMIYKADIQNINDYNWTSSNSDIVMIMNDGISFRPVNTGNATVIGTPRDSGKKVTFPIKISIPYVSSKNIVIDSSESVDFYTYLGSGIIMTDRTGDNCFEIKRVDDTIGTDHYLITPTKPGKATLIYTINFDKTIKVNITVKSSAFDTAEESQHTDAQATARVIKNVNIRSQPTSDSKKMGNAKANELLIVITPFYSEKWHQILYDDEICYVSANYVELE